MLLAWEISAAHLALDSEISTCNEEMVASSVFFDPITSAIACIVGVLGVPILPKLFCLLSLLGLNILSMPPLPVTGHRKTFESSRYGHLQSFFFQVKENERTETINITRTLQALRTMKKELVFHDANLVETF